MAIDACSECGAKVYRSHSSRPEIVCHHSDVVRLLIRFDMSCAYCACSLTASTVQPDHVTPLSRGGSNAPGNLLPCCPTCNSDKSNQTLDEWAKARARQGKSPVCTDPWGSGPPSRQVPTARMALLSLHSSADRMVA